jgi:hemerythrin
MYLPKKLYWEDKLQTGDSNLDFQHKYLFETFNKLGDAIYAQHGKDAISSILERLKFYAEWHFGKEEECMDRYSCPVAQTNKTAHATFLDMFNKYYTEYQQTGGSEELAIKLHETLSDWFLNHVSGIDSKLHPCIHRK